MLYSLFPKAYLCVIPDSTEKPILAIFHAVRMNSQRVYLYFHAKAHDVMEYFMKFIIIRVTCWAKAFPIHKISCVIFE